MADVGVAAYMLDLDVKGDALGGERFEKERHVAVLLERVGAASCAATGGEVAGFEAGKREVLGGNEEPAVARVLKVGEGSGDGHVRNSRWGAERGLPEASPPQSRFTWLRRSSSS